jgi:hypothetical protein
MSDTPTTEEIAQHYSACMNSVNLINAVIAAPDDYTNDPTVIQRNVDHVEAMVGYEHWTDEDMAPLNAAVTAGKAAIAG